MPKRPWPSELDLSSDQDAPVHSARSQRGVSFEQEPSRAQREDSNEQELSNEQVFQACITGLNAEYSAVIAENDKLSSELGLLRDRLSQGPGSPSLSRQISPAAHGEPDVAVQESCADEANSEAAPPPMTVRPSLLCLAPHVAPYANAGANAAAAARANNYGGRGINSIQQRLRPSALVAMAREGGVVVPQLRGELTRSVSDDTSSCMPSEREDFLSPKGEVHWNRRSPARKMTTAADSFTLAPGWNASCLDIRQSQTSQRFPAFSAGTVCWDSHFGGAADAHLFQMSAGIIRHFIVAPSSPPRIVWDVLGAGLIFYDLFAIPLGAFDYKTPVTVIMDWITLCYWTLNVVASLLVGYVKNGITVMIPSKIALHYFKSWFVIDLLVVLPDWIFTLAAVSGLGDSNNSNSDSVKLLRVLRLIRMTRLLRLLKLKKLMEKVNDLIDSEYISIMVNIVKMIVLLLTINHIIACLWFLVGRETRFGKDGSDSEVTWIKGFGFENEHWVHQYAVSFHWSITQFTPASMDVQPMNVWERWFTILIVVFALVGFSYVVGSITGSLTQLRSMQEEASKLFWNLRRYLKQNKVPLELKTRIQRYLEHSWENQQKKLQPVKGMRIFALLSENLTCELQSALYVPHISIHPLFDRLNKVSSVSMHRLANKAIEARQLARRDGMFEQGERATHMYLVACGRLHYFRTDSHGKPHREEVEQDEDWIAEPALWTHKWTHVGALRAASECDLLLVCPKKFNDVVCLNPVAIELSLTYARNFLEWISSQEIDQLSDITQGDEQEVGARHHDFMEVPDDTSPKLAYGSNGQGKSQGAMLKRAASNVEGTFSNALGKLSF